MVDCYKAAGMQFVKVKAESVVNAAVFLRWYRAAELDHPTKDYMRTKRGLTSAFRSDSDMLSEREILQIFREIKGGDEKVTL